MKAFFLFFLVSGLAHAQTPPNKEARCQYLLSLSNETNFVRGSLSSKDWSHDPLYNEWTVTLTEKSLGGIPNMDLLFSFNERQGRTIMMRLTDQEIGTEVHSETPSIQYSFPERTLVNAAGQHMSINSIRLSCVVK